MRKPKVLVISPAGRTYRHDNVEWYAQPISRIKSEYFNIGDMIVYDSTLKLLDYEQVEGLVIDKIDSRLLEFYKTFDFAIVRASNFIHSDMDWKFATNILEQLDCPVYAIGVGAQSSGGNSYLLNEHNLKFWKLVSERSKFIGVRGAFSAEVLELNGIKNTMIVGCPSMFRAKNRNLKIQLPSTIDKLAFSIRREADATYTADIRDYLSCQRKLLIECAQKYDVTITVHGEPEEKAFYYRDRSAMKLAEAKFLYEGWWSPDTLAVMTRLYRDNIFFFLKVEDYDEFIVGQDFALGYRVHGVLPALAQGTPGLLVNYDSRSGELAKTHCIPSIKIDRQDIDLDKLMLSLDYSKFNSAYSSGYDSMKNAFLLNGIPNRM